MLGLSRRQAELCAHLAEGSSYDEIARKIGVRPASVIDHVRKMYTRLDVRARLSLLQAVKAAALMCAP